MTKNPSECLRRIFLSSNYFFDFAFRNFIRNAEVFRLPFVVYQNVRTVRDADEIPLIGHGQNVIGDRVDFALDLIFHRFAVEMRYNRSVEQVQAFQPTRLVQVRDFFGKICNLRSPLQGRKNLPE